MIGLILSGVALVLSVVMLFVDIFLVKIAIIPIVLGCGVFFFLDMQSKGRAVTDEEDSSSEYETAEKLTLELESVHNKANAARLELDEIKQGLEFDKNILKKLYAEVEINDEGLPVLDKLSNLVIEKTESTVIELTERIFSIVESSKHLGKMIQDTMAEMTTGEKSIAHDVRLIQHEITEMSSIVTVFQSLLAEHETDSKRIEESVRGISNFTKNITDLAEQTNILAINASIEAARVGMAGRGFSVIAGNVQELSKKSKEIAEQINVVTMDAREIINHSFQNQNKKINTALGLIQGSRNKLTETIEILSPQVEKARSSIETSNSLSSSLTENLHNITVSLQFQDVVRQVLEHIMSISKELAGGIKGKMTGLSFSDEFTSTPGALRVKFQELAERYFTVEDEWNAVGDEFRKPEQTRKKDDSLKGNVELF